MYTSNASLFFFKKKKNLTNIYIYSQLPSYDMIIPALLRCPLDDLLDQCTMRPGIPLKPMLAHPTKSLTEVLDRFEGQTFTCEFKYDGERAQIHRLEDGTINVYSRNSENMSVRYPDIMNAINKVSFFYCSIKFSLTLCSGLNQQLQLLFWIVKQLHGIKKLVLFYHFKY